jgi:benzylsuccinate CoA-transferase BbsF subunit
MDADAPLAGVRVVEFGWIVAGTLPGMFLADLGAQVIKVESARRLDLMRNGPLIDPNAPRIEQSPRFHCFNRGKLGLSLDLGAPESRDILERLIGSANVVVENFSPGVLDKLGLGYSQLSRWRPDLVMASITAVGQSGPWSDARGYALTISALSGFASLTGYDGSTPFGDEFMCPDVVAALHSTVAVLAALHHQRRTGQGQYIDVSMLEAMTAVLAEPLLSATVAGVSVPPGDTHDPSLVPHGIFPCSGHDNWVAIAVSSEVEWQALCAVIGADDLASDPYLSDRFGRQEEVQRIDQRISAWSVLHDKYAAATTLQAAGVAAAPVLDLQEHVENSEMQEAHIYEVVNHPILGDEPIIATPWSSTPEFARIRGRAPLLGEHNEQVLREILGFSEEEYLDFDARGTMN